MFISFPHSLSFASDFGCETDPAVHRFQKCRQRLDLWVRGASKFQSLAFFRNLFFLLGCLFGFRIELLKRFSPGFRIGCCLNGALMLQHAACNNNEIKKKEKKEKNLHLSRSWERTSSCCTSFLFDVSVVGCLFFFLFSSFLRRLVLYPPGWWRRVNGPSFRGARAILGGSRLR